MSLNEDSSKYCRPDMLVEDDAVCMECKLMNVLNCESDVRKATLLPLRMMQERDLSRGLGLLADSKYVYSFFIELDNDSNYYKWIYCHRFEMDQLYDRCLLFFILLRFLIQRSGNKVLQAEYNRLKALATTWENEKKGNDSSATIVSTQSKGRPTGSVSSSNHSSTQRSIHSNTISTTQAQQKKKLLFKKHIKDRTERILNDVSNFHNIHSH
ncbi:hypothetical protein C9374_003252 [Naegleria lovaniensis]|nr:uncharacterized protein C9374_003252 [Naegleria lovaniensis]KAG2385437.1 hypothetical protein C9374_003252 [Naegleria lovaniensis]